MYFFHTESHLNLHLYSNLAAMEETFGGEMGLDDEVVPLVSIGCLVSVGDELIRVHMGGPMLDGVVERFTTTSLKSSRSN